MAESQKIHSLVQNDYDQTPWGAWGEGLHWGRKNQPHEEDPQTLEFGPIMNPFTHLGRERYI